MIKKVLMEKPNAHSESVKHKYFVMPIRSEEYLKDVYSTYIGDYVGRKFEEKYKLAGGKLPLGSVIHVKHPNGKNHYYGIVIFSKERGYIETDKIKDALDSISLPDGEVLYVDDKLMGLNFSNESAHSDKKMDLSHGFFSVVEEKGKFYNRPYMARAFDMCNHDVVVIGVDLPKSEIESINKELSLRDARIDSIVSKFKEKFGSMTWEEREEFLKKYDFDFGSSDERTL